MKKTIVILVLMLIAPLAFAQTSSTHKRQTTTTEPITVTEQLSQRLRKALLPLISLPKHSLFVRTNRIIPAAMFSTGLVTLWTSQEESSKPRSNLALACLFIT